MLFVRSRAEFERRLGGLHAKLLQDGMIWVAWPKRASNVATDMTEDVVRDVALPRGLVDVKVCAIDDDVVGAQARHPPGTAHVSVRRRPGRRSPARSRHGAAARGARRPGRERAREARRDATTRTASRTTSGRPPRRLFDFYWGEGIADDVPALAYYLVLSLAPFALGSPRSRRCCSRTSCRRSRSPTSSTASCPRRCTRDIRSLVVGTRDNSPLLLALALFAMLWTTSGGIGVIERCLSRILDVPRHNILIGRIRNLALGGLVAVAVILASLSISVVTNLSYDLRPGRGFPGPMLLVFNALGSMLVFATIYRYAPLTKMRWRSALLGGIPGGLAIQAVPAIVGLYVSAAAGFAAVQLFLLLAIVLLGLYIVALLLLVGAGIAGCAERRLVGATRQADGRRRRTTNSPVARWLPGSNVATARLGVALRLRAPDAPSRRARSAVELLLERRRGRELGGLAGGDLDRLARGRVAALAGGTLAHAELAEACDGDLAASGELGGDRVEGGVDGALCVRTAETGVRGHLLCELLLGH